MRNRIFLWLVVCGLIGSASAQSFLSGLNYSVGGGVGIGRGNVGAYVGNSPFGVVGVGKTLNRLFAVDAEYMFYDLDFRPGVKQTQFLANQSGRLQSISLDGIVNVPRHIHKFGAYGIFGVGFYDRTVSIPPRNLQANTLYEPAWDWWDLNLDIFDNIITPQTMATHSLVAGGFNYGGGITHPLNHLHHAKVFVEYRYHRAYQNDGKMIELPITLGLRW